MSADTDAWMTLLRTRLPGADDTTIETELNACLREFYTKSGLWVEEPTEMTLVDGTAEYDFSTQTTYIPIFLRWAKVDGTEIHQVTEAPSTTHTGVYQVLHGELGKLTLYPTPDSAANGKSLTVSFIVRPLKDMSYIPDEAELVWFDQILDGTLGRMKIQPKKPYSDPAGAQYHLRRFRAGMAQAREVARRKYSTKDAQFRYPAWA
jgi:hypothetical protein